MKNLATSALVVLCSYLAPGLTMMLGGISEPVLIKPLHTQLAQFAVAQMGNQYEFDRVLLVRTQVVTGIMYHMDVSVFKVLNGRTVYQKCAVKVQHRPWLPGQEMTLVDFSCKNDRGPAGYYM